MFEVHCSNCVCDKSRGASHSMPLLPHLDFFEWKNTTFAAPSIFLSTFVCDSLLKNCHANTFFPPTSVSVKQKELLISCTKLRWCCGRNVCWYFVAKCWSLLAVFVDIHTSTPIQIMPLPPIELPNTYLFRCAYTHFFYRWKTADVLHLALLMKRGWQKSSTCHLYPEISWTTSG